MVTFNIDRNYNYKTLADKLSELRLDYDPDNHLAVTTMFRTIQGEAPLAGMPAVFLRLAGCNRGAKGSDCYFCFPTYKQITTLNRGKIRMGDLRSGDKLMTLDDNKNIVETTVTQSHHRDVTQDDLMQIRIKKNGKIKPRLVVVTKEHPFHIKGKGWVKASDLKAGMKIVHVTRNDSLSFQRSINNAMFDADSRRRMMLNKSYAKSRLEDRAHEMLRTIVPGIKYVGDNSLAIGDDTSGYYCPDFVIKGSKKLFEVYDPTFPNYAQPRRTKKQRERYESSRRKHFAKFGYDVEFLTPEDIDVYDRFGSGHVKEFSVEKYIRFNRQVRDFVTNGIEIVEVMPITNASFKKQQKNSAGSTPDTLSVANVTCAPYNHFIIDGMHVHNCDTYFAVNETTRIMLVDEVVEELRQLSKGMELALLVITGGEPLLQARALSTLLDRLYDDKEDLFTMTQFETNGDQFVTAHGAALLEKINDINDSFFDEGDEYPELMPINVVISPKRAIVEPQGGTFLNYAEDPGFFLRLLVSGDPESKYYTVPEVFIENWPQNSFWLSPITEYSRQPADAEIADIRSDIDIEATRRNVARAIKLATQLGFRVSLQAHSYIGIA